MSRILIFCVGGLVIALQLWSETIPRSMSFSSYPPGKQIVVKFTEQDLLRSPSWDEKSENPPVSAREAITLATKLRASLVKDTKKFTWNFESARLTPAGGDKWFWHVYYQAHFEGGSSGYPHELSLVVLMDGTVVTPTVTSRQ